MLNFTLHFSLIFMDKNKLPISPFKQSSKLSRVKGPQGEPQGSVLLVSTSTDKMGRLRHERHFECFPNQMRGSSGIRRKRLQINMQINMINRLFV